MITPARAFSGLFSLLLVGDVVVQSLDAAGRRQQPAAGQPASSTAPASQQQPNDSQQPPTIRRGINYVSVDVIVTDKDGKQVLDLTQNDFSVAEDGKPQTIDNFSVV